MNLSFEKKKVIHIEGVCGTGKTTLVKALCKKFKAFCIPEMPEFNRFTLKPFDTPDNILFNMIKNIEHSILRENIVCPNEICIFDRGFLSIIALCEGMKDYLTKENCDYIISQILFNIKENVISIPDIIFSLYSSKETVGKRNQQKEKNLDILWTSQDRIDNQNRFYRFLVDQRIVIPINANDPIDIVTENCENILSKIVPLEKEKIIHSLNKWRGLLHDYKS